MIRCPLYHLDKNPISKDTIHENSINYYATLRKIQGTKLLPV